MKISKDVFKILNLEGIHASLQIFNRWGKEIYNNKQFQNYWDGNNLASGTYFYIFIPDINGKQERYSGKIQIINER